MTRVVVTTTDADGWWWAGPGVLAPADDALISVALRAFVAARTIAVHVLGEGQSALAERFARDPYDFDGLDVAPGPDGVPLLTSVPDRLCCQVIRTVTAAGTTRVFGAPAAGLSRAA